MIKIAVVEDEKLSQNLLRDFLERYELETKEPMSLDFFNNGLDFLDNYRNAYDIVFMDIEMPHLSGMETAKKLRQADQDVCLIFVTNMSKYAINGYEVDAMDFMVKPVEYTSFSYKLGKAIRQRKNKNKSISIKTDSGYKILNISDIFYLEVVNNYITYHTVSGLYKEKNSLKNVESILKEANFERCNNCYLVNLRYVAGVEKSTVIINEDILQISRPRKKDFINALTKYLGRNK